jgi:hypothetical protein
MLHLLSSRVVYVLPKGSDRGTFFCCIYRVSFPVYCTSLVWEWWWLRQKTNGTWTPVRPCVRAQNSWLALAWTRHVNDDMTPSTFPRTRIIQVRVRWLQVLHTHVAYRYCGRTSRCHACQVVVRSLTKKVKRIGLCPKLGHIQLHQTHSELK